MCMCVHMYSYGQFKLLRSMYVYVWVEQQMYSHLDLIASTESKITATGRRSPRSAPFRAHSPRAEWSRRRCRTRLGSAESRSWAHNDAIGGVIRERAILSAVQYSYTYIVHCTRIQKTNRMQSESEENRSHRRTRCWLYVGSTARCALSAVFVIVSDQRRRLWTVRTPGTESSVSCAPLCAFEPRCTVLYFTDYTRSFVCSK